MLLKVLKKGRQLYRYVCDICGQDVRHDNNGACCGHDSDG